MVEYCFVVVVLICFCFKSFTAGDGKFAVNLLSGSMRWKFYPQPEFVLLSSVCGSMISRNGCLQHSYCVFGAQVEENALCA